MRFDVPTPDGRSLEVVDTGPPEGLPLVFHHGTPQAAVPFPALERPASERGIRVISYSRPGYGASSPRPGGVVADDARDTATILDHVGVDRFLTMGWSGGGPRALACAAVLPDRCRAAACCVGIAPPAEFDGDIRSGMAPENVEEYTAALTGREELARFLGTQTAYFSVTGEEVATALGGLAPPVDRAALTGELADYLAASMRAAGQQGILGWLDDDLTHVQPWGFDLAKVTVPVSVWQGTADTMVPFAHAQWLAANVSGARAHFVDAAGHISLMADIGTILDDLVAMAR